MNNLKARIKGTDRVIEVVTYSRDNDWVEFKEIADGHVRYDTRQLDEVELIIDNAPSPIDWEQRKYEIAKDVMVAFFTNPNKEVWNMAGDAQAKLATIVANNLIKRLNGGAGIEVSEYSRFDVRKECSTLLCTFEYIINICDKIDEHNRENLIATIKCKCNNMIEYHKWLEEKRRNEMAI